MREEPGTEPVECFHCEAEFSEEELNKASKGLKPLKSEVRELFCSSCGCWTPLRMEIQ